MSVGSGGCRLAPATIRLAEAGAPAPPSFDVTTLVVFFCVPEAVPVTFTEKEHERLAPNVAPESATLADPAVAVIVPLPQLPVKPFGVATICPVGSVSVKLTPLSGALALGLERLKVKDVVPFRAMAAPPNAL